jgi:hypothetical protein
MIDAMNAEKVTDSEEEEPWLTWQEASYILPDGIPWYPKCYECEKKIRDKAEIYLNCPVCKAEYCTDCFAAGEVGVKFRCTLCFEWVCHTCTLVCRICGHAYCDDCFQNPNNDFGENICRNCHPTRIERDHEMDNQGKNSKSLS